MSKETALAHAELFREGANGQPFEALDGGNVDGAGQDRFACAKSASLATRGFLMERARGGLGHEKIVTWRE